MKKHPSQEPSLIPEEIKTEHIIQDEWIDFRRTTYRFPDGRVFEPYYSFTRRDFVVIVASDTDGRLLCVRQFRQGIRAVTTEFPAGGIDQRDLTDPNLSAEEAALLAARRELLEETGYESDDWTHLITVPSQATLCDNYAYVFAAKNCRKSAAQHLDDMELLNVLSFSPRELDDLIAGGCFQQALHILAWLLFQKEVKD